MGGRSSGTIERTAEGTLRFEGSLSLENNGGFASFRSGRLDRLDWDLDGSEGLEIRVKGDGRTYIYSCDMRGVPIFAGAFLACARPRRPKSERPAGESPAGLRGRRVAAAYRRTQVENSTSVEQRTTSGLQQSLSALQNSPS